MKNTRSDLRFFSVVDYEEEAAYLRKRANEGWRLTGITAGFCYRFTKSEPEDMIYQLDYHKTDISSQDDYLQMFRDCGWEYLFDCMGYSYFRKSAEHAGSDEGIFCDDESRLDMMKRVIFGRILPMLVIFFACLIPNMVSLSHRHTAEGVILLVLFVVLTALYLWIFLRCAVRYHALQKKR